MENIEPIDWPEQWNKNTISTKLIHKFDEKIKVTNNNNNKWNEPFFLFSPNQPFLG